MGVTAHKVQFGWFWPDNSRLVRLSVRHRHETPKSNNNRLLSCHQSANQLNTRQSNCALIMQKRLPMRLARNMSSPPLILVYVWRHIQSSGTIQRNIQTSHHPHWDISSRMCLSQNGWQKDGWLWYCRCIRRGKSCRLRFIEWCVEWQKLCQINSLS